MKRDLAIGSLILFLGMVMILILTIAGCSSMVEPTPEPSTSAEREAANRRFEAQYLAEVEKYNAEVEKLRLELEHNPNYIQAQTQARLAEEQADAMLRITEMREQMTADYQRMIDQRDAFALTMNDHIAVMKNIELFLLGYTESMENINYNSHGAAENSYWALLGFIPMGIILFGLTVFCVVMFTRLERKISQF